MARLAGPNPPQALADAVHGAYVGMIREGFPGWQSHDEAGAVMVWDAEPHLETGTYDSARVLAPN